LNNLISGLIAYSFLPKIPVKFTCFNNQTQVKTTSPSVSFRETEAAPPLKGGEFKGQVNIMIIPILKSIVAAYFAGI